MIEFLYILAPFRPSGVQLIIRSISDFRLPDRVSPPHRFNEKASPHLFKTNR